jgi:hypothetical protein
VQQLAAQNDALTLANRDLHAKVRNPLHVHWSWADLCCPVHFQSSCL